MNPNSAGLRVWVSRPDPEGTALCELIKAGGDQAIHFPTIDIVPPANISALKEAGAKLGEQDWLIFISPQAVYQGVKWLPALPETVQFAAMGTGSALALEKAGYSSAIYSAKAMNAEGLLALAPFQSIKHKKIAVIRGEGGREWLERELVLRGAEVLSVICYRRALPDREVAVERALLKQGAVDVIISTSLESVKNLKHMVGAAQEEKLLAIPLMVNSERVKMGAALLGFQTIFVADNASHVAMLKLLAEKRMDLCRNK